MPPWLSLGRGRAVARGWRPRACRRRSAAHHGDDLVRADRRASPDAIASHSSFSDDTPRDASRGDVCRSACAWPSGQLALDHVQDVDGHAGVELHAALGGGITSRSRNSRTASTSSAAVGHVVRSAVAVPCVPRRTKLQQVVLVLAHAPADGRQLDRAGQRRSGGCSPARCR